MKNFKKLLIIFSVFIFQVVFGGQAYSQEPPVNTYLADSPWPMSQRNPYQQASSPLRGLEPNNKIRFDFERTLPTSITLAYSSVYGSTGKRVVWGSTIASIFKLDLNGGLFNSIKRIDLKTKPITEDPLSGAYTLVDKDNRFYVPGDLTISVYVDKVPGDPKSDIALDSQFEIPESLLVAEDEIIVGINMTYDGYLVVASSHGLVLVLDRSLSYYQSVRLGNDERVSNSIAVDEDGGIYVVTNRNMHRVQWDGASLTLDPAQGAWTAEYEAGPDVPFPGRLGTGSGSTPTLMGIGNDDKFVVITDGRELMHLVLMWRDEIPADWQPIAPGKDRRIAAEVPITFGDANRTKSISEQSVLVRGYGAMVVNNEYQIDTTGLPGLLSKASVLFSNLPFNTPFGVEKFVWDPNTRTLGTAWANPDISCPNGIPTMSEASNLAYCWGQRGSKWGLEAMNWDTGASVFYKGLGYLEKYNSIYAATQIGDNQDVLSGTFGGVVKIYRK